MNNPAAQRLAERCARLEAENAELRARLEAAALADIAVRNPGIDIEEVRRFRAQQACPHTHTDVTETYPEDPSGRTSSYLVCADCGAELNGPWAGSGVL